MAVIANVALTNTFETWRTRTNIGFTRMNAFAINESSLYANTVTANVAFTSKGLATMQGRATVGTNLTVSGNSTLGAANKTVNLPGSLLQLNGTDIRATFAANTYVKSILANTNSRINLLNTNLTGTNTAIRTLVSDRLQVANASTTYQTKAVERATLANTNTYIASKASWAGLTGTNTALRTLISDRLQVANATTSFAAKATWAGLTTTNTALRTLISDRLQVANASTLYATKASPTTSGLFGHTGRATVSTNLTVSGNTIFGAANKTANVTGWFGVAGRATVSTNLLVSGNTSLGAANKTANVTGWFGVAGRATVSTNLFVGGNTTLNGTTTDRSNALSQTLTDGVTINWDTSLGRVASITLGAAGRTMAAPTNLKVGTYILRVYQDATGSRTITTWNSVFKWTAAVAPVLSTGANKLDIITFFSDGTNLYGSYLPDMR